MVNCSGGAGGAALDRMSLCNGTALRTPSRTRRHTYGSRCGSASEDCTNHPAEALLQRSGYRSHAMQSLSGPDKCTDQPHPIADGVARTARHDVAHALREPNRLLAAGGRAAEVVATACAELILQRDFEIKLRAFHSQVGANSAGWRGLAQAPGGERVAQAHAHRGCRRRRRLV